MSSNYVNIEGIKDLYAAVLAQAFSDYCTCKRALATGHTAWNKISNCQKELDACIDFFHSPRYKFFADGNEELLNVEKIIKRLDDMVDDVDRYPNTEFNFRQV